MMRLFLAIILTVATPALGALIVAPTCSLVCLDPTRNQIPRGLCTAGNTACLCSSRTYSSDVQDCIDLRCRDNSDFETGVQYYEAVCEEALAATTLSAATTSTVIVLPTGTLSTTSVRSPSSSSIPILPTTSTTTANTSSPTSSTPTSTPLNSFTSPTRSVLNSATSSTGVAANTTSLGDTDPGATQRYAIIGGAVGAITLIGILVIVLVLLRRRKRLASEQTKRYSEYAGQEVGTPSAIPHPWRITQRPTYTMPEPSWAQSKEYASETSSAWHSEGPPSHYDMSSGPPVPEKAGSMRVGYGFENMPVSMPMTGPRHPAFRPQQEQIRPVDEYHSIGANFLRDS